MIKIKTLTGEMILGEDYKLTSAQRVSLLDQTPAPTHYYIGYSLMGIRERCCKTNTVETTEETYNKLIKEIK